MLDKIKFDKIKIKNNTSSCPNVELTTFQLSELAREFRNHIEHEILKCLKNTSNDYKEKE